MLTLHPAADFAFASSAAAHARPAYSGRIRLWW